MITFIHTADVHFGMENYGKIDPKTGIHTRLLDFEQSFNLCIDAAIEHNVDFFLFSGDAYKTANPSPTQQKLLVKALLRLHQKQIPTIIIVGNHDNPLSFGKTNALDIFGNLPLDNFYVVAKPEIIHLKTKNGPVSILGIPWPTRNSLAIDSRYLYKTATEITSYISDAVSKIIAEEARHLDPTIPAVLAGHLTVSNGIFSGSEKRAIYGTDPIFLPSQLAIPPFDYVGLGHLHRYQNLNPGGYPAIVYSGSIDRIDFGERKEDKGFCLVTIEKKGVTNHTFIPIPVRPFIQVEVMLNSYESQTEQILKALSKYTLEEAIVKIIYHIPESIPDKVDLKLIQAACHRAMYVVGIIPIRKQSPRERRNNLIKTTMDFPDLLATYFDGKPELKHKKDDLIQKTLLLAQQIANEQEDA